MNTLSSKEYDRPVIQSKWIIIGYQTKYWMEIPWKKNCGKTQLRWVDNNRREYLLLLKIKGWRKLAGYSDIWRGTVDKAREKCRLLYH